MGALGDQDRGFGVQDVAGRLGAVPGRVDPRDGGPGQGRRAEPQREFGGVVEQQAEMRLTASRKEVREERRPCGGALDHLVMTEHGGAVLQGGPVVTPLTSYELRDGAGTSHGAAR